MRPESEPAPTDVQRSPSWRRPRGVAAGTWQYVNERSIADHYDAFVADTPLCDVDAGLLTQLLPGSRDRGDSAIRRPGNRSEIVLDLGCGTGRSALPLARRGYDVIAIDLSQRMLEVMMDKAFESSLVDRIHPVRANLVELECLADRSADHAVCLFSTLGMIQGRDNRRAVLRHAARIVRDGGQLVVHVHNRWAALCEPGGLRALAASWWRSWQRGQHEFGDTCYSYRGLENMFMHRFSRTELIRDLRDCRWRIDRVWTLSIDGTEIGSGLWIPGGYIIRCHKAVVND